MPGPRILDDTADTTVLYKKIVGSFGSVVADTADVMSAPLHSTQ